MKKRRLGPIVALVLLAGLGTWVYFKEIKGEGARPKGEDDGDRPIAFARADLKAITIKNEHGTLRLEKAGDSWKITQPLTTETDKDAVESLLTALDVGRIERRLGPATELKTYGLDPPKAVLTLDLASGGPPRVLDLGDSSPVGGAFFALLPGGREIAVVNTSLGDLEKKDLLNLRDKALLALDPWKVKRLKLQRGGETVLLEKPDDAWKLQEPIETPADGSTVTDLLSALERLRATTFETEKATGKDLKRYVLDPPSARLTLQQEGWDVEKTILFGRAKDGALYARTEGRDPIVAVPKDFWDKITTKIPDLRRKEILGVGQYRIETITAAREGKPSLVLTRQKDASWSASGLATGTIKADSADLLLREIGSLKAQSFDDRPSDALRASLARKPYLDLTLQEEAPSSGGSARSQHLVFGPPEKSGTVKVRDMAWRPIAVVTGGAVDPLVRQLDGLAKEAAASAKPAASPAPSPAASPAPDVKGPH